MTDVLIDVVEPGRAFVRAAGFEGWIGREGRRFYVEDEVSEEIIGYTSTYERAGKLFARYHGIADPRIEIDYEYRH